MKFLSCIFCRISGFFDNRISSRISGLPYPVSGLKPSIKRADYPASRISGASPVFTMTKNSESYCKYRYVQVSQNSKAYSYIAHFSAYCPFLAVPTVLVQQCPLLISSSVHCPFTV